jgi:hypothetical protein
MSKLTLLIAAIALVGHASTHAQRADASQRDVQRLVAACNGLADSGKPERRSVRACESLAADGRLTLVEPAAVTTYRHYLKQRRQACERRQVSPRAQSRGRQDCEP